MIVFKYISFYGNSRVSFLCDLFGNKQYYIVDVNAVACITHSKSVDDYSDLDIDSDGWMPVEHNAFAHMAFLIGLSEYDYKALLKNYLSYQKQLEQKNSY